MASWQCSRILDPVLPTVLGAAPHPTVLDKQQCTLRMSKVVCPKMSKAVLLSMCSPCVPSPGFSLQGSRSSIKAEMQSHRCSCDMLQGCHTQPATCMQPTKRYCKQDLNPAKTATINRSKPKIITLHSLHSVGFMGPSYIDCIDFHFAKRQRQILFHWKANLRTDPENLQAHDDALTETSNLILIVHGILFVFEPLPNGENHR